MTVRYYDRKNIHQFDPHTCHGGTILQSYFGPMIQRGVRTFIRNIDTPLAIIQVDDRVMPLVVAGAESQVSDLAYIVSPTAQYYGYTRFELEHSDVFGPWERRLAVPAIETVKAWFSLLQFDKVVFVNNWLLSTNLYPELNYEQLLKLRRILIQRFPDHALIFRSVSDVINDQLMSHLQALDFRPVVSRHIQTLDPRDGKYRKKRPFITDRKLWEQSTEFHWTGAANLTTQEYARLVDLYEQLYIRKYSPLNPQYTPASIRLMVESGLMQFHLLRNRQEDIVAVTGISSENGVVNTSFIGYDHSYRLDTGLYRFLNLKLMELAVETACMINMSAGAAEFKRQRGGQSSFEYNMVYSDHLPPHRQWPWAVLQELSEVAIKPAMLQYGI